MHLLVDTEFCLFPVLATVNNTSMENEGDTFSVILASFSLALYPEEGLQHHVTVTRNPLLFSRRAVVAVMPTTSVQTHQHLSPSPFYFHCDHSTKSGPHPL